jgi:hypothetical protein
MARPNIGHKWPIQPPLLGRERDLLSPIEFKQPLPSRNQVWRDAETSHNLSRAAAARAAGLLQEKQGLTSTQNAQLFPEQLTNELSVGTSRFFRR